MGKSGDFMVWLEIWIFLTKVGCDVFFSRKGGGVFFWRPRRSEMCVDVCSVWEFFVLARGKKGFKMFFLRHSFKRTSLFEIWREQNWLKTWSENGFGASDEG